MHHLDRQEPEVSILVVSYNCAADLRRCLDSVREAVRGVRWEVLVRDNNSRDIDEILALGGVGVTIVPGADNPGFGRANNEIAHLARGTFLLLLNPDTILESDIPTALRDALLADPGLGAVAPMLEHLDGARQDSWAPPQGLFWEFCEGHYLQGFVRAHRWRRFHSRARPEAPYEVGFAGGACLMLRRDLFLQLGGFDPEFFLNHEDLELCDRVRATGLRVAILPDHRMIHAEGTTQRLDWSAYARNRLVSKWIYLHKRFHGPSLWVARILWWETLLVKHTVGWFMLRGDARSRLRGFRAAAREILRG